MIYALDTNIVIELLNLNRIVHEQRDKAVAGGIRFIIPPIVDYEVCRGLFLLPESRVSDKKEKMYFYLLGIL